MSTTEIWKDIPGYRGHYEVSNEGDVYSIKSNKYLKLQKSNGYFAVNLSRQGKVSLWLVHRLVMLAFKHKSKLCVNHKDGNKENNKIDNLEYCTKKENNIHAGEKGLMQRGENRYNAKLTEKDVKNIRELLLKGVSQYALARGFNVSRSTIQSLKEKRSWRHV